ncbi:MULTISPECIES: RIP metalloprotease RseP [unclassified Mucilaginibacter]|uniref:RIP metalloprotease RseP n=1 Tax=unclassified Mucilaginibacter TaxID=2617802 RepID=UPI0009633C42|nr:MULTISPECIES: RIP metalloprotease RseP [unclassified Mucilaginibacter]OJW18311.1 MAG: RIP metalloprotease RseP [Mucilaginibacter sp. 44-25]PLW88467.1 MAG: RIP metalloprotease RseP [Mucilaginibacter sp.]PMP66172.1 MAG: RIP metalloprotease RseP [Mucilaginibacter sp.]HEK21021.1 RIP metalloprotease RseP [Bacteroidota bacterium]
MSVLVMAGQLILGLSILVILHEFGHFLAARAFGIKVEKFYLFFDAWGVSLFKFNYKGVEYGIGWLPLGGYVKIAGMIDESMDTEQMAGPPQPWEFRAKPAWQRLIVMLGGIIVNIIVGIFIFWMLTIRYGESYTPMDTVKYGIVPGKIGQKMGLKAGDKITAVNGKQLQRFEDLVSSKVLLDNTVFTVQRGDSTFEVKVPPTILNDLSDYGIEEFISLVPRGRFSVDSVIGEAKRIGLKKGDSILAVNNTPTVFYDQLQTVLAANKGKTVDLTVKRANNTMDLKANIDKDGHLGFFRPRNEILPDLKTVKYGFFEAFPVGARKAWGMFADNAKGIKKIFSGQVKATKAISSPLGIAEKFGGHVDWLRFWSLVGFLSMVLALTNLLPIPGLDGGHTVFLIIEMIKGKPLSDKFLERAQIVGFVLLISLMVFAFGNDIVKIVTRK